MVNASYQELEDEFYTIPVTNYSSDSDCDKMCPADCAFRMMSDGYIRVKMTTARQWTNVSF